MKRILALLITLLVLVSCTVISTSAAEPAKTKITVNKGDVIDYTLNFTLPEKLVGWDMSVYYDSSKLKVTQVTDYSGGKNEDEWAATAVNPNLKDEVRYIHSILSGVKCDNKALISVKFEAATSQKVDTNISYYIRFLYPESMEQFTEYKITCDVSVNGEKIADDAQPELNTEKEQTTGYFTNSVTGEGSNADVNIAENSSPAGNSSNNNGSSTNKKPNKPNSNSSAANGNSGVVVQNGTTADGSTVDSASADSASADQNGNSNIFQSAWFWIVVGVLIVGLGLGGYLVIFKKKIKFSK